MHDGWLGYRAHSGCRHALCNIHHLRELTFLEEQYHQPWARDPKALLLEMKAAVEPVHRPAILPQLCLNCYALSSSAMASFLQAVRARRAEPVAPRCFYLTALRRTGYAVAPCFGAMLSGADGRRSITFRPASRSASRRGGMEKRLGHGVMRASICVAHR